MKPDYMCEVNWLQGNRFLKITLVQELSVCVCLSLGTLVPNSRD